MTRLRLIFLSLGLSFTIHGQQLANLVNNGGFEECRKCNGTPFVIRAKHWDGIDTNQLSYQLLSKVLPPYLVPQSSYANQWPRNGNNYIISMLYFMSGNPYYSRAYPRNRLKQTLDSGKTYCVKLYYCITEKSSYGVNSLGAYFGDSSTDTIHYCTTPLTYLTPQVQSPNNVMLTDTAHWRSLAGTFTANGNEIYLLLGNFKSDNATDTILINPNTLPLIATDILYEDISCIDIDLPAYAGPDQPIIPGDSVYIGRESDVEIDESCIWYQLTSPTTSLTIDTIAGLWVKPTSTSTYVVRQQLWCSVVKWDTVVVFIDAVGLKDLRWWYSDNINLFPNPTETDLTVTFASRADINKISIINSIGQVIREEDLQIQKTEFTVSTSDLDKGIYLIQFKTSVGTVTKTFVKN